MHRAFLIAPLLLSAATAAVLEGIARTVMEDHQDVLEVCPCVWSALSPV
jgi:hypothetical protein